mgnify:CR=1 FL=1
MSETRRLVVVIEESVVSSLIKDAGTFLMFAGLLYFNHKYLSGSVLIDALFIILAIMTLAVSRSSVVFKGNKRDAIEWLKDKN